MDWHSAVKQCERDDKQLLCYRSKKEMDDITEAFRLAAYGNAELELWLSAKNCSEPQVMEECLSLHIRKSSLKLWHYFQEDCKKQYPFVCCVKDSDRLKTTTTTSVTSTSTTTSATSTSTATSTSSEPTSSSTVEISSTSKVGESSTTQISSTAGLPTCKKIERRGILWPETPVGDIAVVNCPGNSIGKANWTCEKFGNGRWSKRGPNLRDCRSLEIMNLKERFNRSSITDTLSLLEGIFLEDEDKEIFGEDLADAISLMTSLPDRVYAATQFQTGIERWTATKTLVEKSTSIFDHIIDLNDTWREISEERKPSVGTHFLSTIDGMGLILADAMSDTTHEDSVKGKNMVLQVAKIQRGESLGWPMWEVSDEYSHRGNIELEKGYDVHVNPKEGNISVVFTLYPDLTSIFSSPQMQNGSTASGTLNSAVISATVSQNRKPAAISNSVKILVEHLVQKPNDTACVFWDMKSNDWNTHGCRLESSNDTYSLCVCDHLTNFAVLMDYKGLLDVVDQRPFFYITVIGCSLSIICLAICVVVFSCYSHQSKHSWGLRYVIHRNLCLTLLIANLVLVVGVDKVDYPKLCTVVAGMLHYFFLSAFSWMLLEGVHIYLLLVVVFASRRSHWEKYYLFGYGNLPLFLSVI
ncbi:adhesion G protein-coupled receptor L1 [Caerostris extrusa]|uniref:Adhesion G protein-coupled receptor L1 n=1 Tax=Caerostris extrusa TaxID=172846 RepID=A0AAV4USF6_CAEEX|nr:adhesion G protein-coupled receptor L1 [Caerostris extrusa]